MSRTLLLVVVLASTCGVADGGVMIYTERTEWIAAAGGAGAVTTETFDGATIDPIPVGVVTDVGEFSVLYTNDTGETKPRNRVNVAGSSRIQLRWDREAPSLTDSLMLLFDTDLLAFGANFRSVDDGDGLTMTAGSDLIDIDTVLGASEHGFVGFVTSSPFSSLDFGGVGDTVFRMNTVFTSQVPEPSAAFALVSLALAGMALTRRRFRHAH